MKVLVIGGAGYIGAHVTLELLDTGHSVVVFDNFSSGEILNIDKRSQIFRGSILSKTDLTKVFKSNQFDAVMHFAALKAPGQSMINPEIYSETNIVGSINILNEMLKNKVSNYEKRIEVVKSRIMGSFFRVIGDSILPHSIEDAMEKIRGHKDMITKNTNLTFLSNFNIPKTELVDFTINKKKSGWTYLCNYKNNISNIKMNINLFYKFTKNKPKNFRWYSIEKTKKIFLPSFTKKIINKISKVYTN